MKTIAELEAALAGLFICVDGPPRAYFELPINETSNLRVVYTILSYPAFGSAEEVAPTLISRVWEDITAAWADIPEITKKTREFVLFWHYRPEFFGGVDAQDRSRTYLGMSLAIPGLDIAAYKKKRNLTRL